MDSLKPEPEEKKAIAALAMQATDASKAAMKEALEGMAKKGIPKSSFLKKASSRLTVRAMGIDQSFSGTGWSFLKVQMLGKEEKDLSITEGQFGTVSSPTELPLLRRCQLLREQLRQIIDKFEPDVVGIESAILEGQWVAGLNGLYFMLMDYLQFRAKDTVVFQPTQLKSLIKRKRGLTKKEIQAEALTQFALSANPNDNEADALFLAWNAARFTMHRRGFDLVKTESEKYVFFSKEKTDSKVRPDLLKGMMHRPWESYYDFSDKQSWLRGELNVQRTKKV